MKKVLLATLLSAFAINAFAANTVDLQVAGVLTNSACTPSLPNGGKVDFGKSALSSMSATDVNQLGYRDVNLTLTCDAATALAFTATDAHNDSAVVQLVGSKAGAADSDFGLGKTAGGVKLGAYTIMLQTSPTVDDVVSPALYSAAGSTPSWSVAGSNSFVHTNGNILYTPGNATTKVPTAFKKAVFPLRITASVQDTTTLAITDDTNLDGLATFSIIYL
ncbi:DUF1120 domain-containing protein [Enterobacter sp. N18-03635]|uniref:DUF1120 domain-containing protein n=1 Tax=Enterobacter sp. N18-03635 TaxID=2500132 RepID=UPI000FDAB8F5|nr:DUF1120 domain-containing protein [Enterobacter sp. N18-03635]AZV05970.1 DUF1120 domain-containing protein [Enterobacter sp. N18-03635]